MYICAWGWDVSAQFHKDDPMRLLASYSEATPAQLQGGWSVARAAMGTSAQVLQGVVQQSAIFTLGLPQLQCLVVASHLGGCALH